MPSDAQPAVSSKPVSNIIGAFMDWTLRWFSSDCPWCFDSRRTVYDDFIAKQANSVVGQDANGFLIAEFGPVGHHQRAIANERRLGVASQEGEVGPAAARGIQQEQTARTEILA